MVVKLDWATQSSSVESTDEKTKKGEKKRNYKRSREGENERRAWEPPKNTTPCCCSTKAGGRVDFVKLARDNTSARIKTNQPKSGEDSSTQEVATACD